MEIRKYPYTAWRINQKGKPVKVTLVKAAGLPGRYLDTADIDTKGKVRFLNTLFSFETAKALSENKEPK